MRITLISICALLAFSVSRAQQAAPQPAPSEQRPLVAKFSGGMSPFGIFNNRIKIDLEHGIPGKSILLCLNPTFYTGYTDIYTDTRSLDTNGKLADFGDDQVSGFGGEAMVKFVRTLNTRRLTQVYGGIGLGYHKVNLKFMDYSWASFEEGGLRYYRYALGEQEENIKRIEGIACFGMKVYAGNFFYFDSSIGLLVQKSNITSTLPVVRKHYQGVMDFGNTGTNLRFTFTMGVSLF